MKKMLIALAMLIGSTGLLFAKKKISGTVVDKNGKPVAGAMVTELTTYGAYTTVSDSRGRFTLNLPDPANMLYVTSGDSTGEARVKGKGDRSVLIVLAN